MSLMKQPYIRSRAAVVNALFDERYGLDTAHSPGLEPDPPDADHVGYQPIGFMRLRRMLPRREVGPSDVFLDLGSGKGRAVIQAALHYPFKRVEGVEISPSLHEVAVRNVDVMRGRLCCENVRLHRMDVLDFAIPDDTSVVLLNNPFTGDVFRSVVARLLESASRQPRPLRIIYSNPIEEGALLATGRIEPVRALRGWRPGRDWSRSNSSRLYTVTTA
jgi:SAM-dependent methyltransferase